jgi:hypothetical protein
MSAKVARSFEFQSAVHFEGTFAINTYNIELSIDVQTEDPREQQIALERIKYIFSECLESCVFVNKNETKSIDAYLKAGIKVCTIPEDPFDQIVAAVLLSKFNTITENKIHITDIKIKSLICDDVVFFVSDNEDISFTDLDNGWWNANNAAISDIQKTSKKEKIVEIKRETVDWNTLGLTWKQKRASNKENGEIVFIPLDK